MKTLNKYSLKLSAAIIVGVTSGATESLAATASNANFSTISGNVTSSISGLPGLLSGVAYMMGILLGVLGILKIKDHVENPSQTPLQHGAIRLTAGGGLFALPIVYEAMQNTIGNTGSADVADPLNAIGSGLAGGTSGTGSSGTAAAAAAQSAVPLSAFGGP